VRDALFLTLLRLTSALFLEGTHAMPGLPDKDGVTKYVSVVTSKSLNLCLLLLNVEVII
jgi:hypothetical protein